MEYEDILRKAITKAIKNTGGKRVEMLFDDECISIELRCGDGSLFEQIEYHNYYSVIFDIDFAKAFWGETVIAIDAEHSIVSNDNDDGGFEYVPSWKYHLQEMVLVKPPIDYIKKFL